MTNQIDVQMDVRTLLKIINGNWLHVSPTEFEYSDTGDKDQRKKATLEVSTLLLEKRTKLGDTKLYQPNVK